MGDPISPVKTSNASAVETDPSVKVMKTAEGRKIYQIETAIVIEGRIQKPTAFYFLQRSSINYEWASLRQSFLPRIFESVTKESF